MTTARVPRGTPAGGQFAASAHAEAGVVLAGPVADPVLGDDPPLVEFDEVYHVGTLNPGDREDWSYEGDGLSVSVHPDEWADIARLGGGTWTLSRPDGEPLRLVSWHDLDETGRDRLRSWAAERGWIEQVNCFAVTYEDDEWQTRMTITVATEDDARAEAEENDGEYAPVIEWRATDAFPDRRVPRDLDPSDVLLAAYVRDQRPDLDGVWWDDEYDRERLSCPRGVLVGDLDRYDRRSAW